MPMLLRLDAAEAQNAIAQLEKALGYVNSPIWMLNGRSS